MTPVILPLALLSFGFSEVSISELKSSLRKSAAECNRVTDVSINGKSSVFRSSGTVVRETRSRYYRGEGQRVLIFEIKNDKGEWEGEVFGENAQYQFNLVRNSEKVPWAIKTLKQDFKFRNHPDNRVSTWLNLNSRNFFATSISLNDGLDLLEVLDDDEFNSQLVTESKTGLVITPNSSDASRLRFPRVEVEFYQGNELTVSCVVATNEVRESRITETMTGYGKHDTAYVCPEKFKRTVENAGVLKSLEEFEFHGVNVTKLSESEFRLTAFGLPEPVEFQRKRFGYFYWIAGLVLIGVIGLSLRYVGRRV